MRGASPATPGPVPTPTQEANGDDIRHAREILEAVMAADERILRDRAPAVMVLELGESSVDLAARPWVNSADDWAVGRDRLEAVKGHFDAAGISTPDPQRDAHLVQADQAP